MQAHTSHAAPAVDEATISAAKERVGTPAKGTLAEVRSFVQRAHTLLNAPDRLRESAAQQVAALANQQAQQNLRSRDVTELRSIVGKGARLGALADAGFRTVADVAALSAKLIMGR